MKSFNKKCLLAIALGGLLVTHFACKKNDGYNTIVSTDKTQPDPVSNVQVINFNGGAYITYDLPESKNILYVQAEYNINDDMTRQAKSSYYSDTIMVSGFAQSKDYTVKLYTVSRADVKSDSVLVTVHPDTPPYLQVWPTIHLTNDFGGVRIEAENESGADIGIVTITPDDATQKMEIVNQHYTNEKTIAYSLRGYDTIPRQFGVYVTDKWGNRSDTVLATIKPIYEVLMDKSKFQQYVLPSDVGSGFGWVLPYLWDGNTGSPGYHSPYPTTDVLPRWVTFDMGQAAKLSRYTVWFRGLDGANYLWTSGAPETWVMWGRSDQPVDESMPDTSSLPQIGQATANGWINMGIYHLPAQPSGLEPPQYTNADLTYWNAGFGFNFSLDIPEVRYIRFQCVTNAAGTNDFFNIMEMSLWGNPG